ncbi:hypothetical protein HELRODRAFT_182183 [Helobdella robusta]|uniref:Apple domain-containing protein n=1 Tax=Helobdella robusta TaxID=6412 RepID=T1FHW1_HELRO|nr:hypothetical protein HELRODRAFT_182183 [Helobdella robusta]ESN91211.1 hypothetical protein HELRODRAFT_182183 [Helobdella robusta]
MLEKLLLWCLLLFMVNQTKGASLSTLKNVSSSSIYYPDCYDPSRAVDGKYMQDDTCVNMFLGNDVSGGPNWWLVDLGVKYFIDRVKVFNTENHETSLNMFIVGLSNIATSVDRNTYDVCDQFSQSTSLISSYQVKYSKVWLRNSNRRLKKSPMLKVTASSRMTCVIQCNIHKCCSANFNEVSKICECFQNLKGSGESYVAEPAVGWDNFKFQFV